MYAVQPSIQYVQSILYHLEETTAYPLTYWLELIRNEGITDEKRIKGFLISNFNIGATKASVIASYFLEPNLNSASCYLSSAPLYVEKMFQKKEAIRPIFDYVINFLITERPACKICPCETIVPIYHHHVIAQCKPSTKTRLDFGLALKHFAGKLPERIIDTGGLQKKDRITHCFQLSSIQDFDKAVIEFFDIAFELDKANNE